MMFKSIKVVFRIGSKIMYLLINSFSIFGTFVFKFKKLLKTLNIPKMQISRVNLFFHILKFQYSENTHKVLLLSLNF